ncbi:hypothetical protein FUAX_08030 [Fulvitalea axinellae]|uniref:Uncharacterized protein n=1 Tax=Fulvitalea axinellae TaxID=1182444 RepID=A0AAU9CHT1_9BACT|nr:hypothetical protein FUAX_08030 [Fulvitalea axinellae]
MKAMNFSRLLTSAVLSLAVLAVIPALSFAQNNAVTDTNKAEKAKVSEKEIKPLAELDEKEPEVVVVNEQNKIVFQGTAKDFKKNGRFYKAEFLVAIGKQKYYMIAR